MNLEFLAGMFCGLLIGFLFGSSFLLRQYKKTLVCCKNMNTPEKLFDGTFVYLVPESEYNEMKEAQFRLAIRDHMIEAKKNRALTPVPFA